MDDTLDDWITCPYNYSHRVRRGDLAKHIVECEWQNPDLIACPYNVCHRYTRREMINHVKICSSKPQTHIPQGLENMPLIHRPTGRPNSSTHNQWYDYAVMGSNIDSSGALLDVAGAANEASNPPASNPPTTYRPRASFLVPRAYMSPATHVSYITALRAHYNWGVGFMPSAPPPPRFDDGE